MLVMKPLVANFELGFNRGLRIKMLSDCTDWLAERNASSPSCAACLADLQLPWNDTDNLTALANLTADGESSAALLSPSLPGCIGLSALGGLLEVISTMCLAYPEYKAKLGQPYSACTQKLLLLANLLLMGIASLLYIVGSWFGPVSLSVPTVMVSKLVGNMAIMGAVLKMTDFPKEQQVGTFCIAMAILTLPDVGPSDQEGQDAVTLVSQPVAIIWTVLLMAATIACCVGMVGLARRAKQHRPASNGVSLAVYVTAQVTSAVIGTSVSKMFALAEPSVLAVLLVLAVFFAAINVVSLILAAKAVDQAMFVPMQTCATLLVNMVTGLLVWEEFKVITAWGAYFSVHAIMMLAVYLLSPSDWVQQYRNRRVMRKLAQQVYLDAPRIEEGFANLVELFSGREDGLPPEHAGGGSCKSTTSASPGPPAAAASGAPATAAEAEGAEVDGGKQARRSCSMPAGSSGGAVPTTGRRSVGMPNLPQVLRKPKGERAQVQPMLGSARDADEEAWGGARAEDDGASPHSPSEVHMAEVAVILESSCRQEEGSGTPEVSQESSNSVRLMSVSGVGSPRASVAPSVAVDALSGEPGGLAAVAEPGESDRGSDSVERSQQLKTLFAGAGSAAAQQPDATPPSETRRRSLDPSSREPASSTASSSGGGQRGMSGSLSAAQLALASIFRPAGPPDEVSMALRETEVQAWVDTLVVEPPRFEPPSVLRSHSAPSGQSSESDGGADRIAHA